MLVEVGSSLRQARERQGLALVAVERATRLRVRYLRALEEDRLDLLPPGSYARVFLRDYATFLGLDPQPLLDALPEPEPEIAPHPEPPPLRPLPLRAAGLGAVVLVLVAAALVLAFRSGGHPRPAVAPAHARAAARPKAPAHVAQATPAPVAVLTAARGDCWILVKRGDRVVWRGTLHRGSTIRLGLGRRLWLRLGAPWNLAVQVGGRPVGRLPHTTANVLLSRAGLAQV